MAIGFYFDATNCTECKTCQIACKDIKNLPTDINYRKVTSYEGGTYPTPWVYFISMACNHCDLPACLAVCPVNAIIKEDDGTVVIDTSACIGCKSCITACPYGAPKFREELGIVDKCDACKEYRDKGENPACVDACPLRALYFGEVEELSAKYGAGATLTSDAAPLPSSDQTSPNLLIKPAPEMTNSNYLLNGVI
jgi:anaerobic dimethyl sulfoxide reductase subunit B (iron-sulfur subunit)